MKNYSTIIWDFNGTIIDDVQAALLAVNDMLMQRGQNTIDIDRYYSAVDVPIWKFYETVFQEGTITPEEAMIEFNEGYEKHLQKNPLMSGVTEVLDYFNKLDKTQIVVSASHVDKVKARLSTLGIIRYFNCIFAHSDYNAGDKTYLAKEYIKENNISLSEVVVIGDCIFDSYMAESLGCDCILNTKGHQSRRELSNTSAQIIDSLTELKKLINDELSN